MALTLTTGADVSTPVVGVSAMAQKRSAPPPARHTIRSWLGPPTTRGG